VINNFGEAPGKKLRDQIQLRLSTEVYDKIVKDIQDAYETLDRYCETGIDIPDDVRDGLQKYLFWGLKARIAYWEEKKKEGKVIEVPK